MSDLHVQIIWKTNPAKVTNTRVASSKLAEYQTNLGPAWDDIRTFTISSDPIPSPVPVVRLHDIDLHRDRKSQDFDVTFFDADDQKAAVIKTTAVKLQEFALRVLQQTTYSFQDAVDGK